MTTRTEGYEETAEDTAAEAELEEWVCIRQAEAVAAADAATDAAVKRLYAADRRVHSAYDGECEHGFGPPATRCPNAGCPDRELAEAWAALL